MLHCYQKPIFYNLTSSQPFETDSIMSLLVSPQLSKRPLSQQQTPGYCPLLHIITLMTTFESKKMDSLFSKIQDEFKNLQLINIELIQAESFTSLIQSYEQHLQGTQNGKKLIKMLIKKLQKTPRTLILVQVLQLLARQYHLSGQFQEQSIILYQIFVSGLQLKKKLFRTYNYGVKACEMLPLKQFQKKVNSVIVGVKHELQTNKNIVLKNLSLASKVYGCKIKSKDQRKEEEKENKNEYVKTLIKRASNKGRNFSQHRNTPMRISYKQPRMTQSKLMTASYRPQQSSQQFDAQYSQFQQPLTIQTVNQKSSSITLHHPDLYSRIKTKLKSKSQLLPYHILLYELYSLCMLRFTSEIKKKYFREQKQQLKDKILRQYPGRNLQQVLFDVELEKLKAYQDKKDVKWTSNSLYCSRAVNKSKLMQNESRNKSKVLEDKNDQGQNVQNKSKGKKNEWQIDNFQQSTQSMILNKNASMPLGIKMKSNPYESNTKLLKGNLAKSKVQSQKSRLKIQDISKIEQGSQMRQSQKIDQSHRPKQTMIRTRKLSSKSEHKLPNKNIENSFIQELKVKKSKQDDKLNKKIDSTQEKKQFEKNEEIQKNKSGILERLKKGENKDKVTLKKKANKLIQGNKLFKYLNQGRRDSQSKVQEEMKCDKHQKKQNTQRNIGDQKIQQLTQRYQNNNDRKEEQREFVGQDKSVKQVKLESQKFPSSEHPQNVIQEQREITDYEHIEIKELQNQEFTVQKQHQSKKAQIQQPGIIQFLQAKDQNEPIQQAQYIKKTSQECEPNQKLTQPHIQEHLQAHQPNEADEQKQVIEPECQMIQKDVIGQSQEQVEQVEYSHSNVAEKDEQQEEQVIDQNDLDQLIEEFLEKWEERMVHEWEFQSAKAIEQTQEDHTLHQEPDSILPRQQTLQKERNSKDQQSQQSKESEPSEKPQIQQQPQPQISIITSAPQNYSIQQSRSLNHCTIKSIFSQHKITKSHNKLGNTLNNDCGYKRKSCLLQLPGSDSEEEEEASFNKKQEVVERSVDVDEMDSQQIKEMTQDEDQNIVQHENKGYLQQLYEKMEQGDDDGSSCQDLSQQKSQNQSQQEQEESEKLVQESIEKNNYEQHNHSVNEVPELDLAIDDHQTSQDQSIEQNNLNVQSSQPQCQNISLLVKEYLNQISIDLEDSIVSENSIQQVQQQPVNETLFQEDAHNIEKSPQEPIELNQAQTKHDQTDNHLSPDQLQSQQKLLTPFKAEQESTPQPPSTVQPRSDKSTPAQSLGDFLLEDKSLISDHKNIIDSSQIVSQFSQASKVNIQSQYLTPQQSILHTPTQLIQVQNRLQPITNEFKPNVRSSIQDSLAQMAQIVKTNLINSNGLLGSNLNISTKKSIMKSDSRIRSKHAIAGQQKQEKSTVSPNTKPKSVKISMVPRQETISTNQQSHSIVISTHVLKPQLKITQTMVTLTIFHPTQRKSFEIEKQFSKPINVKDYTKGLPSRISKSLDYLIQQSIQQQKFNQQKSFTSSTKDPIKKSIEHSIYESIMKNNYQNDERHKSQLNWEYIIANMNKVSLDPQLINLKNIKIQYKKDQFLTVCLMHYVDHKRCIAEFKKNPLQLRPVEISIPLNQTIQDIKAIFNEKNVKIQLTEFNNEIKATIQVYNLWCVLQTISISLKNSSSKIKSLFKLNQFVFKSKNDTTRYNMLIKMVQGDDQTQNLVISDVDLEMRNKIVNNFSVVVGYAVKIDKGRSKFVVNGKEVKEFLNML